MDKDIASFLSEYKEQIFENALKIRGIILENLPGVQEQLDIPAKMIAYAYGQKYADMICTLIPSKKALKLGFYKGAELPDPDKLLTGNGKISRYVEIRTENDIDADAVGTLLKEAFMAYQTRKKFDGSTTFQEFFQN